MTERALIVGASGGIGSALAKNLRNSGTDVVGLSRIDDGLDVTDETSVRETLARLEGQFDLIVVATGALVVRGAEPEKSVSSVTATALADQFAVNALGPMMILKHSMKLIPKDRRAVFAALSARVGSIGDNRLGGWHSYRAAKAALNQLIHGAAIEMSRSHKRAVLACLHPGTVETPFTSAYAARHNRVPAKQAAQSLLSVMDNLTPEQSGGFFDYSGAEIPW